MTFEMQQLYVVSQEDSPANRIAAEKALREKGVLEVRHQTALDITSDRVILRSDGYAP